LIRPSTRAGDEVVDETHLAAARITWTWLDGGTTAQDDWETPTG
jgi:hypothetical protein